MNKALHILLILIFYFSFSSGVISQTPTDALMMDKGQVCIAGLYSNESWDHYWEGTLKRVNGNIGTLTRQTYTTMVAFGLADRINLMVALPYVKTEASAGQIKGSSGFQDMGLWLKATAFNWAAGPGQLSLHAVAGASLPSSNYLEDYGPFSLGLGCPDFSLRGILQYRLTMGLYARGNAAYLVRGNSKIERDFYYTTTGIYSDHIDMPNAMTYAATLGIWMLDNSLNIEATYDGLQTYGGFDIRRQDVGFPSNKMIFTRLGGGVRYFIPFLPGLSVLGQYSQIQTGRNVGQSTVYTAGLTYLFNAWNKNADHTEMPN